MDLKFILASYCYGDVLICLGRAECSLTASVAHTMASPCGDLPTNKRHHHTRVMMAFFFCTTKKPPRGGAFIRTLVV